MKAIAPQATRDQALALFLNGLSITEIAEKLGLKHDTVQKWKDRGEWSKLKTAVVEASKEIIKGGVVNMMSDTTNRQLERYRKLQEKGLIELDTKETRTAGEAGSLIDIGIKGEREIAKGLISFTLITELARIVAEEVSDEDERKRIAARLKGMLLAK